MNIETEVMTLIREVEALKTQVSIMWKINLGVILASMSIIVKDVFGLIKAKKAK
jgi:hypothetical protein